MAEVPINLQDKAKKIWEEFSATKSDLLGEKLNFIPPIIQEGRKLCVIDLADVISEVNNWNDSIVCTVLGSKPLFAIFEGFVHWIWAKFGVNKVIRLDNSQFIVKFTGTESRDRIVERGIWFFDRKPLVVRP